MRSPAFSFYPKQWLGDDIVLLMDWDARGMHLHLMCISWQQNPPCSIPNDDETLRKWLGNPKQWATRLKAQILEAWDLEADGRWHQNGLLREWRRQKANRENGAKGGRPKTEGEPPTSVSENENPNRTQTETQAEPKVKPNDEPPSRAGDARAGASSSASTTTPSSASDTSGDGSASTAGAARPPAPQKRVQNGQLPLPNPTEDRAREILARLWPVVQPALRRGMTQDAWRKKSKAIALDFARLERTDDELLAAHASASKRIGSTAYSLAVVRDELVRLDNPRAGATAGDKRYGGLTREQRFGQESGDVERYAGAVIRGGDDDGL